MKKIDTHYTQIKKYENFLQDIKKLNNTFYPHKLQVSLVENPRGHS